MDRSDRELLAQIADGNREAMRELHARYADRLFRFAYVRLQTRDEAEDVVQETLIAAWQGAKSYRSGAPVSTWLFGICRHKIGDLLRKRRSEEARAAANAPASAAEGSSVEFWEAFGGLADEQQELILLVFHYGFSQQEVAEILQVPVGTVKSRVFYARRRLQELLTG